MKTSQETEKENPPVESRETLIAWFHEGNKPRHQWRIGTEHEKFGFRKKDLTPIPYEGDAGIKAVLILMAEKFGWEPVFEDGLPIALTRGPAAITLEPGGQLELSGAPLETIHETQDEINEHLHQLGLVCRDLDIAFLGIGVQPKWRFDQIPWMPKGRYRVMRDYLPTRGKLSLDMMTRTTTVQANLDYADERDMVRKFRLMMAVQPVITALFANSPFIDGRPNGFTSYRAEIWRHTDPDRCGFLPFVFDETFGFDRYVEYALNVPMLFYYREGRYHPAGGVPFGEFFAGRFPLLPGQRPTLDDWALHLSTLFPDVRLKRYLETRGADAGNSATLCALPAFWKGLLYDDDALEGAWDRVAQWSLAQRRRLHAEVPRTGLGTALPGGGTLRTLALELLELARDGLRTLDHRNPNGCDESIFLKVLFQWAESGRSPADRLLVAYRERWGERVDPVFTEEEFESFYGECG
ncbi:MAG: glutamate--cysteine ligase [Magnetococcales bacterium]|nr:glutamate--cysteine ligase [Magnetococcales bacterium]